MNTVNSIERQRTTRRFAAFFAVSVVLVGLIFAAISFHIGAGIPIGGSARPGEVSGLNNEQEKILTTSASLQAATQNLKQYDDALRTLGTLPASVNKRELLLVNIRSAESQLSKGISNLLALKKQVTQPSSIKLVERLAGSYAYILNMRTRTDPMMLNTAANKQPLSSDIDRNTNSGIGERDKKIAELEKQLAVQQKPAYPSIASGSGAEIAGENENLVQSVAESKRKMEQAFEQVAILRKENARLAENNKELSRTASSASRPDPDAKAKMEAMNADLSFLQVDCNLSRADAKQIISNSRQRRELLNEALRMLNSLSQSENSGIRKKAAEKLAMLNFIAKNIRE